MNEIQEANMDWEAIRRKKWTEGTGEGVGGGQIRGAGSRAAVEGATARVAVKQPPRGRPGPGTAGPGRGLPAGPGLPSRPLL